jgi:NAD(P)-dependent dehydrogenase (short-subunit alcohol dehydrogenase family)
MDLARPNEIEAAIAQAEAWHGGIDVLVNNAGIGYAAAIEEGEDKNVRAVFETNVFGLINIIRAALPAMRGRGRGTIVNISSTNGVVSMPGLGFYSASKHAVEAITDALRGEVAPLGLKVLTVEPGGFRTGIAGRNLRSRRIAAYDQTAHQIMDFLRVDNQDAYAKGDPDRMAKILVDLVGTGDMPSRLILGADSFGAITGELAARKAEYEKWKDTSFAPISNDHLNAARTGRPRAVGAASPKACAATSFGQCRRWFAGSTVNKLIRVITELVVESARGELRPDIYPGL